MKKDEESTFHGGFVRNRGEGRGVRVARAKVSELPVPDPITVQETALALEGTRTFPNVKSPLKARKTGLAHLGDFAPEAKPRRTKLAVLGIPSHILDKGSPAYARCVRMASSYKKARVKELYQAHGHVSSGVSALIAAASLALSASRFLYEAYASAEEASPGMLKLASSLADSARQNELSAWELCARESVVRKRNEQNSTAMPWLVSSSVSPGGEVKRKPGRPRKAEVQALTVGEPQCLNPVPQTVAPEKFSETSVDALLMPSTTPA